MKTGSRLGPGDAIRGVRTPQSGANATCLVCGRRFVRYRKWQAYCGPKCRKQAWLISHRAGAYTDIRQELAEIKAMLQKILGLMPVEISVGVPLDVESFFSAELRKGKARLDKNIAEAEARLGIEETK